MAKKRMFNNKVLDTDAFLELPLSAQALYFHLNLRADDDGFIGNPKRVKDYVGASDDDLKLLVLKRFLIAFEDGVVVVKHWRMHNTIQKDRYTPTDYLEDLRLLGIKENKAYTLDVSNLETKCIQNVSTDIGIDIDKEKDIDICQQIVDEYHTLCPSLPKVRQLTDKRKSQINSRLKKYSLDDFKEVFTKAEQSDFLKGSTGWKANFDFLINEGNMVKVLEGNYENRKKETKGNSFNNFDQRNYDDLERMLLQRNG